VAWVQRIIERDDRVLSAQGLRDLAHQCNESHGGQLPPLTFAEAETRLRRLVVKLWKEMGADGDDRTLLLELLRTLSRE
jgi:hypothetical protein